MSASTNAVEGADIAKVGFVILDDKPFFRDMVHTALSRSGARDIKFAADVQKAKDTLRRYGQQIGCVICDWDIAPVGGLELLRMIRTKALPKTEARTPVIIVTTQANTKAVKAALALDVNGFAVAPLSVEKLIKVVVSGLGREWMLRTPEFYRAVPAVEPTKTLALEVNPKEIYKRPSDDKLVGAAPAGSSNSTSQASGKSNAPSAPELINTRLTNLARVEPGQIVARDIKDKDGTLMIKTGTELNSKLISRLKDIAGEHHDAYHLWVGEWDKTKA